MATQPYSPWLWVAHSESIILEGELAVKVFIHDTLSMTMCDIDSCKKSIDDSRQSEADLWSCRVTGEGCGVDKLNPISTTPRLRLDHIILSTSLNLAASCKVILCILRRFCGSLA
jgi:hypothetical protein